MKKIKALLLLALLTLTATDACAQFWAKGGNDLIMLRDGSRVEAKINQISGKVVKFKNETSGVKLDELPLTDIYMIKYAKRGTMFFTKEGNRKTGEQIEADSKATMIYTTDYREIPAYELEFDVDKLVYRTQKATRKNPQPTRHVMALSQVFMIIYPDGTSETVTELDQPYMPETAVKAEDAEKASQEPAEEQLKVVFHTVKQGDTLNSLAGEYGVTADNIKEWNELGAKIKPTTRLQPGQQLILYVKPEK